MEVLDRVGDRVHSALLGSHRNVHSKIDAKSPWSNKQNSSNSEPDSGLAFEQLLKLVASTFAWWCSLTDSLIKSTEI